jgi:hypothetical protein
VKVSVRLENLLVQALSQSMAVERMEKLARRVIEGYDLHRQSGFPSQIPIPQRDAAQQVIKDMVRQGQLRRFCEVLIDVDRNGIMGRPVSIRFLPRIIGEIENLGYLFSEEYRLFVEGQDGAKTRGWGVLEQGQTYEFSFLRVDIAGSSRLVRKHPKAEVLKAYADLRGLFTAVVEKREGRIWQWEGDGGTAAFLFGAKNVQAVLAGMQLLMDLFMYNLYRASFADELRVRLAVHTGPCLFLVNFKDIRSDTLQRLELIESRHAASDSLIITPGVYSDMGTKLESFFRPVPVTSQNFLYQYSLRWE